MAKKQIPGQQQIPPSKETKQANPSPMTAEHASLTGLRTASKIDARKIKPDDLSEESTAIMEDGSSPSADSAADAGQPVLVAQLNDAGSAGGGTAIVPDAGNVTDQNVVVALADGAESGSGRVSSNDAPASGGMNGWWLVGGLAAVGIGGGIAASGGSSGGSGTTAATVSGTVTDGPVQGARLYYDTNANGVYDEGTDTAVLDANGQQVVTDELGNFSFTTTQNVATIRLVTAGGTDTVTGETVTLNFSAPAGYAQINPITSAIAAYMEANPEYTAAQAEAAVKAALGLPDLDYSAVNLFDPPAGASAADILAAQKAAAILATTAIVIAQSGADADAFQYVAENMGTGGSTSALVTAVRNDSNVGQGAADQLAETVAAVEAATSLDAIGEALNDTFFAEVTASGTMSVGQTLTGQLGLGNATGLEVAYQWQSSADGTTWTDIAGATGTSYQLTSDEAGDHIRLKAVYTDTAGVAQTVYGTDMGVVPVPNAPPVLGDYTVSLAENSADGTAVQTVAATDADGDTLSYAITAGNASGAFAINAATGAITVADSSKLDFETTTSFNLTVEANDGTVTDSGTVTVNLTNVNDNTPSITSGGTGSVAENAATGTIIYDAAATDADAGSTLTYSLKGATGDVALLNIDASTGAVTLKNSANFETKPIYTFTVIASDGANSSEQAVTVSVTNVNEAPIITSGGTGSIAENTATSTVIYDAAATDVDAGTTIVYSLKAATGDVDLLNIDATTGEVTLKNPADFETKSSYTFTVVASDGVNSSEQAVTATVTNVNESVVVESTGAYLDLNANGVKDAEDTTAADFTAGTGNVDLSANPVTIHFNDVPDVPIDLTGFTSDDKIEIDVGAFNATWMQTTPAQSFTSLQTGPTFFGSGMTYLYLAMNNFNSYSVFFNSQTSLTPAHKGALAFYTTNFNYLAYWNDSANPLLDIHNIVPGIGTASGWITSGSSAGLSSLNQGAGHGILIDFIWPPPSPQTAVVVEANGAWVDSDADGVHDANEVTSWAGGRDNMVGQQVTIHFNNVPGGDLDLTGFGADDLIQIDVQAFIDNGHNILQILTQPNMLTLNQYTTNGTISISSSYNWLTPNSYGNSYWRETGYTFAGGIFRTWVGAGLRISSASGRRLNFFSNNASTSNTWQLATQLSTNLTLQQMVDFVNLPAPPDPIHVVAERDGAFIDVDGDGVKDGGENWLADFSGGNADLATNSVIVHFNDIPQYALDLTGFGTDDRIEFDIKAMQENNILHSYASQLASIEFTPLTGSPVGVRYALNSFTTAPLRLTVMQTPGNVTTFNGTIRTGVYALNITTMWTLINGTWSGAFAYWTDSGNALNDVNNILPGYTGGNTAAVLDSLNSNVPHAGLIDFLWPVSVVVDDQAGNVATFIDANANGVRDAGENTLALLGQTQEDVDAFNNAAGTSYDSQIINLESDRVTIHYNDLPTAGWMPDLTGFNGNDRIEIDIVAMRNNLTVTDIASLTNQITQTMSSQTQIYSGMSGVSMGSNALYLAGGNLKFGHRTTTPTNTGPSPLFNAHYTATGAVEGTIGVNANALASNFQQVVFVTEIT